jgi:Histidine kinase-like ATPase domain
MKELAAGLDPGSSPPLPLRAPGAACHHARAVFGGTPGEVSRARAFARQILGPAAALDDALLLLTELCTNAVAHTASGDNGTFEVTICQGPGMLRVEVCDGGANQVPAPMRSDPAAGAGRGLVLVDVLAKRWGFCGGRKGRVVFFELPWDVAAGALPSPRST